jgi:tetratricopeptide (TPR) repeat protein
MRSDLLIIFLIPVLLLSCDGNEQDPVVHQDRPIENALADVEQRILASPQNGDLFAERARLNEQRDSMTLALNDWKRALVLDSLNAANHIGIADLYFRKVKLFEADKHFRKAASLDPKATEPRLKLAEMELLKRNYRDAMGWANDALRIDPQHARGYYLKGYIHMEAGDTALAVSSFRTAIEQDPSMFMAYEQLGVIHAAKRDPLAMQYYNSALDLQPDRTETLYALGMFAQENGMDSLALKCYDRIKDIDPKNAMAWYNTGYIHLEHRNDPNGANEQFTGAIARAPMFAEAYFNRGLSYERQGVLDSAYIDFKRTLAIKPDMTAAAEAIGRLSSKGLRVQR